MEQTNRECVKTERFPRHLEADERTDKVSMRLSIITSDPEFKALCERTLEDFSSAPANLLILLNEEQPMGDACIWEFHPASFPVRLTHEQVQRSLFVLDKCYLGRFRECLGGLRASIVLKPVLDSALRPFLEHSFRACEAGYGTANHQDDNSAENQSEANLLECLRRAATMRGGET